MRAVQLHSPQVSSIAAACSAWRRAGRSRCYRSLCWRSGRSSVRASARPALLRSSSNVVQRALSSTHTRLARALTRTRVHAAQDACPDPPAGGVPHGDAGDCTSHTNHTCTYTCNEGYQCSPECTTLPCAANCARTCNNGTAFTAPMTCSDKPCTGVDPPVIGAHMHLGDCTDPLLSGQSCKPECDEGYVLTAHGGHSSGSHAKFLCTRGAWNTLTCEPKGCTAAAVIAAAAGARIWTPNTHGDPPFSCGALSGGQPAGVCTPTKVGQHSVCVPGYTPSTNPPLEISCSTGTVTVLGSCDPSPCNCGDNYPHGNRGTCHPNGNHMESGTLCTPNCTDGYMLATPKRCLRGGCSGGTCIGKPCNATAVSVCEYSPSCCVRARRSSSDACDRHASSKQLLVLSAAVCS